MTAAPDRPAFRLFDLDHYRLRHSPQVRMTAIVGAVAAHLGVPVSDILGRRRHRPSSLARHLAMALCREMTTASVEQIGRHFGRHHSSVLYALETWRAQATPKALEAADAIRAALGELPRPARPIPPEVPMIAVPFLDAPPFAGDSDLDHVRRVRALLFKLGIGEADRRSAECRLARLMARRAAMEGHMARLPNPDGFHDRTGRTDADRADRVVSIIEREGAVTFARLHALSRFDAGVLNRLLDDLTDEGVVEDAASDPDGPTIYRLARASEAGRWPHCAAPRPSPLLAEVPA